MENNRRRPRRRTVSSKAFVLLLALVLVIGVAAGGTLAWLVASSNEVVNTFTYGDINITLEETTGDSYKIVPGVDIAKDPKVTVQGGSEDCWLFVKVEKAGIFVEGKVSYDIADGWTALAGQTGVYYREVSATKADTSFDILKGNKITVSENLTKTEVNGITAKPTLTFTAYAVQKDGIADASAAWEKTDTTSNS